MFQVLSSCAGQLQETNVDRLQVVADLECHQLQLLALDVDAAVDLSTSAECELSFVEMQLKSIGKYHQTYAVYAC
jgi:hypothetical protein